MTRLWMRRRLVFGLALCLVTVLFAAVVVRTWPSTSGRSVATPTPLTHATYRFQLEGLPSGPLHPGQRLTVRWVPVLVNPTSSALPINFFCGLELYGPYASQTDANKLTDNLARLDPEIWPIPTVSAEPRYISNQNPEPLSVLLPLPTTLRPGLYVAASLVKNTYDLTVDSRYVFLQITA